MAGHVHAESMAQYAEDAKNHKEPWRLWEWKRNHESDWKNNFVGNPSWDEEYQYRRKPKTININGIEVPEPVRDELVSGTQYFTPCLHKDNGARLYYRHNWNCDHSDKLWLKCGLIHLTPEAAEIHTKALLSFTEVK